MTRRKKTDGERLTQRIAEGLAIDNWIDEIWIAKRIDRLLRRRMAEAWDEGHEWGVNDPDSPRPCCRFHLCTNPYRGRKKKQWNREP